MTHSTAKLGAPSSDVVIAKVGVSYPISFMASSHTILTTPTLLIAWAYEDDLDIDTCLGYRRICGNKGRYRCPASRSEDVPQQWSVDFLWYNRRLLL